MRPVGGADRVIVADASDLVTVDLALVLAIDCSSSVDDGDFRLQMEGIAAALRDPLVHRRIAAGKHRQIAISLVHWSNARSQFTAMDWRVLSSVEQLERAAEDVDATIRQWVPGGTGLAAGMDYSTALLLSLPLLAERRAIDVSGDGEDNENGDLAGARNRAAALGITVNGLPITHGSHYLLNYYLTQVIVGPDAFVEPAKTMKDYKDAIRRKLLREIGNPIS